MQCAQLCSILITTTAITTITTTDYTFPAIASPCLGMSSVHKMSSVSLLEWQNDKIESFHRNWNCTKHLQIPIVKHFLQYLPRCCISYVSQFSSSWIVATYCTTLQSWVLFHSVYDQGNFSSPLRLQHIKHLTWSKQSIITMTLQIIPFQSAHQCHIPPPDIH